MDDVADILMVTLPTKQTIYQLEVSLKANLIIIFRLILTIQRIILFKFFYWQLDKSKLKKNMKNK